MPIRVSSSRGARGFSLVELMVAAVVGMVGIIVITSVFVQSQGQNRTTTGGASAQENALIALATLEQDLRMAGIGLFGTGCTSANGFHAGMTSPTFAPFPPLPAWIARDPTAASDGITIIYSGSPFGNIWTTLAAAMPTSNDVLAVTNGNGYVQGDLIMISQPPNCSLIQASANATVSDGVWTIEHLPGGATPFNPPAATNIFVGGYPAGARVTNMGPMVRRNYFVQNGRLMMQDLNLPASNAANPVPVVDGVVALRAQYGRDTSGNSIVNTYDNTAPASAAELVAVRIAVVARSGQLEKEDVSPAEITLWNGGTVANGGVLQLSLLGADARRYRYRVYRTIVPLRNIIWTP